VGFFLLKLSFAGVRMRCMCKWVAIVLLACMVLLGSGIMGWMHAQTHLQDHHAIAAASGAGAAVQAGDQDAGEVCQLCLLLHLPLILAGLVALLADSGERVYWVGLAAVWQKSQGALERISCRGPPGMSVR
jgi:hypothetical protein